MSFLTTSIGFGVAAEEDAVWEGACALAGASERGNDMEEVGIVALAGGRRAEGFEALIGVVGQVDAVGPALIAEGRIGDDVGEGFEGVADLEFGISSQGVALRDERRWGVVQDHVHAGESGGSGVLFLAVEGDLDAGRVADFQQQGAGAAGGVVDGGRGGGSVADADDLGHDAGDLGGGVELALALAAFGGEVAHEVFVGVAQDVVAFGAVLGEVEGGVFEDGDQVGEAVHLLFAGPEFGGVVEVGQVGQLVGVFEGSDDFLVDLVADVGLALQLDHVFEAGAFGNSDGGVGHAGVFVADVFDEEEDEDVVLVLAGVHAAAEFVATGPEGAVEFGDQ